MLLSGQGFPCDGSVYYVGTNTVVGSKLYKLTIEPVTGAITSRQLPLDNPEGRFITALGYNVRDRMLYGIDFDTKDLLRISNDGRLEVLARLDVDPNYEFYGGGAGADGRRLFMVGRNKETGRDDRLYSVRINDPGYPVGYFPLVADRGVALVDLSIDPRTGQAYSFDEGRRQVVEVSLNGQVYTNLGFKEVNQLFGSLFFDRNGQMYAVGNAGGGNAEQTTIYKVNKSTGETERFTRVPGGRDTDACACPYTLDFEKQIYPKSIDGCGEITIEYKGINYGGIAQLGVSLRDTLPPGFMIKEVDLSVEDLFVKKISGEGTNVLALDDWNVLIGENTIRIKVQLMTPYSGPVPSQALMGNLFAAYGSQMYSDDPDTPEPDDATVIEIIDAESYQLEDYLEYSCDLDTAFLRLPLNGDYQWSTGRTDSVLAVTESGQYALTLTTDCFTVEDDIQLNFRTEPYFVDLGDNRTANLGESLRFSFRENLDQIQTIRWQSLGSDSLSCTDCPEPALTAIQPGEVQVTVTDTRGCTFTDRIAYDVRQTRNIYLPNAFSPNRDGVNDIFVPLGDRGEIESFQISDRWGNVLYNARGGAVNGTGWDGRAGTQLADAGVYFYRVRIRFPDGLVEDYEGTVLLVR